MMSMLLDNKSLKAGTIFVQQSQSKLRITATKAYSIKKYVKKLLLFSGALTMSLLFLQACASHLPFKLVTTSPRNTYRVEIAESSSDEYGAIAHWNAFKYDKKIIDQSTIYNAAPPPYFDETYTDYVWLTDSQLWLGKGSPKSLQQYDEI